MRSVLSLSFYSFEGKSHHGGQKHCLCCWNAKTLTIQFIFNLFSLATQKRNDSKWINVFGGFFWRLFLPVAWINLESESFLFFVHIPFPPWHVWHIILYLSEPSSVFFSSEVLLIATLLQHTVLMSKYPPPGLCRWSCLWGTVVSPSSVDRLQLAPRTNQNNLPVSPTIISWETDEVKAHLALDPTASSHLVPPDSISRTAALMPLLVLQVYNRGFLFDILSWFCVPGQAQRCSRSHLVNASSDASAASISAGGLKIFCSRQHTYLEINQRVLFWELWSTVGVWRNF